MGRAYELILPSRSCLHWFLIRSARVALCALLVGGLLTVEGQAQPSADTAAAPYDPIYIGFQQIQRELQSLTPVLWQDVDPDEAEMDGVDALEIDGLVVDETQTKLGRDFYEVFYSDWEVPDGAVNFTVIIDEQPIPNMGTRIIVRVNGEIAFQGQLQPRYDFIEQAAQFAVARVQHMLQPTEGGFYMY